MAGISVIVTTRNEAAHIGALMQSLQGQKGLVEVILVDAMSDDDTVDVARDTAEDFVLKIMQEPCSRGAGRNLGAAEATGELLAFIDGDCTADADWIAALASAWGHRDDVVVVGATEHVGPFPSHRAPVMVAGQDVSWPSCNMAIPRGLFRKLGGFDSTFLTAEDMDLNIRAVQSGARLVEAPAARVQARTRATWKAHLQQAHDYGVGRAQLEAKHGAVGRTSKWKALKGNLAPRALMRLASGYMGYRAGRRAP